MATNENNPIDSLRKLKGDLHRLRVTTADGSERIVAVPNVRQRWQRIAAALDQLEWQKLEAENAEGDLLALLHNEELPEPEPEPFVSPMASTLEDISGAPMPGMLAQFLQAQELVMVRYERMSQQVFESQTKVIEILSQQLVVSGENHLNALEGMHNYALLAAEAESTKEDKEEEDSNAPMIKAAIGAAVQGAMSRQAQASTPKKEG